MEKEQQATNGMKLKMVQLPMQLTLLLQCLQTPREQKPTMQLLVMIKDLVQPLLLKQ